NGRGDGNLFTDLNPRLAVVEREHTGAAQNLGVVLAYQRLNLHRELAKHIVERRIERGQLIVAQIERRQPTQLQILQVALRTRQLPVHAQLLEAHFGNLEHHRFDQNLPRGYVDVVADQLEQFRVLL